MKILENYSLRRHNTFNIECYADFFCSPENEEDIERIFSDIHPRPKKTIVLGDGSNILFKGDFHGIVIHPAFSGIEIADSDLESVIIKAGAGEKWHDLVSYCVANKYYGLENLALIPGTVGAAPVQNIGAYGAEQDKAFYSLRGYDMRQRKFVEKSPEQCGFSYRDSVFKNELADIFIISSVKYRLSKKPVTNLTYGELRKEFPGFPKVQPGIEDIYNTICTIRQRKLPDPEILGNAGSFFKNPFVDELTLGLLNKKYKNIPSYISGSKIKIPAAWLIEKCGWKGKRIGNASVYEKHSLVLVNYGNAGWEEIIGLANKIKDSVFENFGIMLSEEVRIV